MYPNGMLNNLDHRHENDSLCGVKTHYYLGHVLWFNHGAFISIVGMKYYTRVLRGCSSTSSTLYPWKLGVL
jgi:hypothetical protein